MTESEPSASFVAVGDLMLGDSPISVGFGLRSLYPELRLRELFFEIEPVLHSAEVVIGNLECPLTRSGVGATRWKRNQLRGDPEYAKVLAEAGFTALNLANNHALQHGASGLRDTVRVLREHGIAAVGLAGTAPWACSPVVVTSKSGLRVGLLGYSWRPDHSHEHSGIARSSASGVVEDVRRLRASCDAVVVSLHWGEDFVGVPSEDEKACALRILGAGAALIVGHHPQVLRPVLSVPNGAAAFSLGNFVSDISWMKGFRTGGLLRSSLRSTGAHDLIATEIALTKKHHPVSTNAPLTLDTVVSSASSSEYLRLARLAQATQRRAAYMFALRHLANYHPLVAASLLLSTCLNKLPFRPRRAGPR